MGDDTGPHGLTGLGGGRGSGGRGEGGGVGVDARYTTPHRGVGSGSSGGGGIAEGRKGDTHGRDQMSAQQAHPEESLLSPSGFYHQPVAFVGSLLGQAVAVPVGGMRTASDLIVSNSPFKM